MQSIPSKSTHPADSKGVDSTTIDALAGNAKGSSSEAVSMRVESEFQEGQEDPEQSEELERQQDA